MEGIVIKSIDYKEKSKIVYLYTKDGMDSVKALDVSKSKLGFVTTLNHVKYEKTSAKLPTLVEYSIIKSYYGFYESLSKVGVIMVLLDIINHLEEASPNEKIYSFLLKCLDTLEASSEPLFVLSLFLVKMLAVFGVRPNLKACVICGATDIAGFSVSKGGALCRKCLPNNNTFKVYEAFYKLYYDTTYDENNYSFIDYKSFLEVVYSYYSIHANIKLKSYKIV